MSSMGHRDGETLEEYKKRLVDEFDVENRYRIDLNSIGRRNGETDEDYKKRLLEESYERTKLGKAIFEAAGHEPGRLRIHVPSVISENAERCDICSVQILYSKEWRTK